MNVSTLDTNFSEHIINIGSIDIADIITSVNAIYTDYKTQANDLIKTLESRPYWVDGKVKDSFQKLLRSLDLLENSVNRDDDAFKVTDIEIYATAFVTEHYQILGRLKIFEGV